MWNIRRWPLINVEHLALPFFGDPYCYSSEVDIAGAFILGLLGGLMSESHCHLHHPQVITISLSGTNHPQMVGLRHLVYHISVR